MARPSVRLPTAASRRRAAPLRADRRRGSKRGTPGCSSQRPSPTRSHRSRRRMPQARLPRPGDPVQGVAPVPADEVCAESERDEGGEEGEERFHLAQSVEARPHNRRLQSRLALGSENDAAEALPPHAGPDSRASRGARSARRAGHPSPFPDFKSVFEQARRAAERGVSHRERRARVHRVRNRRLRVGLGESPGEKALVVSHGNFGRRWQKMAAAFGSTSSP